VLTSYNLALAVAALPAAYLARRRPVRVFAAAACLFAGASLVCALASTFELLVAARTVQGLAGAALAGAALALLVDAAGGEGPGARIWILAGIVGAALGPAAGGILTQLLGWESIFVVQVPVVLVTLAALAGATVVEIAGPVDRPDVRAALALVLLSAALVAALFLLVILLINGWRLEPLAAGLAVSVLPLAAIAAARLGGRIALLPARAASGATLVAGGLAALGWLPGTGVAWTIPPQIAVGAGLGLALSALTELALARRSPLLVHAGWTLAARHAGVVLGLVLLTPIFIAGLERNEDDALAAGTSVVLDSRIPPLEKIGVARDVLVAVDEARVEARVPAVAEVVAGDDPAYADLVAELQSQLDRAVTNACSQAFLAAALLGLLALVPILLRRQEEEA
jgi:MFS family permease